MMPRITLLMLSLFFLGTQLFAQLPPPCPSNTTIAADECGMACNYCNFSGLNSTTAGYSPSPNSDFCGTVENDQWLSFVSSEATMIFQATPTSSTNGQGLEMALYADCASAPIACYAGQPNGGNTPAVITANNLSVGRNYFLRIDGKDGDICAFSITASAITPPLPAAPVSMTGATTVCPGVTVQYCVPPIPGAAGYTWNAPPGALVNGQVPPVTTIGNTNTCVNITYPSNATAGVICVNGANSCYTGPPLCTPVSSLPIPPTFLPSVLVCTEDLPYITSWGTEVINPGIYEHTYISSIGCDSLVRQFVQVKISVPTVIPPTTLCGNQTLSVCGEIFTQEGSYTKSCPASDGCDSNVIFTIIRGTITASIGGGAGAITCTNTSTPLTQNPGPGTAYWYALGEPTPLWVGPTFAPSSPGTYIMTVNFIIGSDTCSASDTITIQGDITIPSISVLGGVVDCGTTTTLTAGTDEAQAVFSWVGPGTISTEQNPTVSTPGTYVVVVTNPANGCTASATAVVTGDTDLPQITEFSIRNTMAGQNTGAIIVSVEAGGDPVTIVWTDANGNEIGQSATLTNLPAGTYTCLITNTTNNCSQSATFVIEETVSALDLSENAQLWRLFPNPNQGKVFLEWTGTSTIPQSEARLFDAVGKMLHHSPLLHQKQQLLPWENLPSGHYSLEIRGMADGKTAVLRFVVQR